MTAALRFQKVQIPTPAVPFGDIGVRLWRDAITEYADWQPQDLVLLNAGCIAWQEVADITAAIADERDFRKVRQLRADRNAAIATYRQVMRELGLSAKVPDTRPARIPGRYA